MYKCVRVRINFYSEVRRKEENKKKRREKERGTKTVHIHIRPRYETFYYSYLHIDTCEIPPVQQIQHSPQSNLVKLRKQRIMQRGKDLITSY